MSTLRVLVFMSTLYVIVFMSTLHVVVFIGTLHAVVFMSTLHLVVSVELCWFDSFLFPLVACELELDPNTAYRKLQLSEDKRIVKAVREYQQYPDHPDRFDCFCQLLCSTVLTGRCYWEVEWKGVVHVAVTYAGIRRKGNSSNCRFGMNNQSWSLCCSQGGFSIWYNNRATDLPLHSSPSMVSNRVAVYVDYPAGTLSFYRVSSGQLIHLHTFSTTFTQPLYAGFGIGIGFGIRSSGSVSLR